MAYKQAYALVLEEKWAPAKTAMDDLVRQFPKSAWVDDARFWSCYALEKTGQSPETVFKCYQKFVGENPGSEWADDAKSNMIRLAQGLAKAGQARIPDDHRVLRGRGRGRRPHDGPLRPPEHRRRGRAQDDPRPLRQGGKRQAQEPDRLHARRDGISRGFRQAPCDRPRRDRRGGPPRGPLRRRLQGRSGSRSSCSRKCWPRMRRRSTAATRSSRWPKRRTPAWSRSSRRSP